MPLALTDDNAWAPARVLQVHLSYKYGTLANEHEFAVFLNNQQYQELP